MLIFNHHKIIQRVQDKINHKEVLALLKQFAAASTQSKISINKELIGISLK